MRVLVCGGRDYKDSHKLWCTLNEYDQLYGFSVLMQGGAKGADRLAKEWGEYWLKTPPLTFNADWVKYPKAAGPIRNKQMLDEGKPDLVIAFPGGKGTKNMVDQARARGVKIIEIP